jgi:hypothetical protein
MEDCIDFVLEVRLLGHDRDGTPVDWTSYWRRPE